MCCSSKSCPTLQLTVSQLHASHNSDVTPCIISVAGAKSCHLACSPMLCDSCFEPEALIFQPEELSGEKCMGLREQDGLEDGWMESCTWELEGKERVDECLVYQDADHLMGLCAYLMEREASQVA